MISKPGFLLEPHSLLSRVGIESYRDEWHRNEETEWGLQAETMAQEGQDGGARGVSSEPSGKETG